MNSTRTGYDIIILSGDVGGTNTNLSLMGKKGGTFTLLFDRHYKTKTEPSFIAPLARFIEEARQLGHPTAEVCCVSGAGPVRNNTCVMTNAPWDISGPEIEAILKIKAFIINDFMAVSYGVALLDVSDESQITVMPHSGEEPKHDSSGTKVIVGAGTGLGVGYLNRHKDSQLAFPSEGGHVLLPVFSRETSDFYFWLTEKYGEIPGAEAGVSGQGIANLFAFNVERSGGTPSDTVQSILSLPELDRPQAISLNIKTDALCEKVMDTFVKLYAWSCSNAAVTFLPSGGLYLAGGIASKNEAFFLENNRFMAAFEAGYREHVREILAATPVYIVKDYAISLYGSANAAVSLM